MHEVFPLKKSLKYNSKHIFETRNVNFVHNGTETLSLLEPKIWFSLPNNIKQSNTLIELKRRIRTWKPVKCACRLCKLYVSGIGIVTLTQ